MNVASNDSKKIEKDIFYTYQKWIDWFFSDRRIISSSRVQVVSYWFSHNHKFNVQAWWESYNSDENSRGYRGESQLLRLSDPENSCEHWWHCYRSRLFAEIGRIDTPAGWPIGGSGAAYPAPRSTRRIPGCQRPRKSTAGTSPGRADSPLNPATSRSSVWTDMRIFTCAFIGFYVGQLSDVYLPLEFFKVRVWSTDDHMKKFKAIAYSVNLK